MATFTEFNVVSAAEGWLWPLPVSVAYRVSCQYGDTKYHADHSHKGIDLAAAAGSPIIATKSGSVQTEAYNSARGNWICIRHSDGSGCSVYQHMLYRSGKTVGTSVKQGDVIGFVGNTGDSSGNHLHFELWKSTYYASNYNPMSNTYRRGNSTTGGTAGGKSAAASSVGTGGSTASAVTGSGAALGYTATGDSELSVVHIPEKDKFYTKYRDDDPKKEEDAYVLAWQKWDSKTAYDITARCGTIKMADDYASVCTVLSFEVLGSADDAYLHNIKIETGDAVSLTNSATKECVFRGQVERTSGTIGQAVSVTAYDNGRLLSYNEIICQFDNCSAHDALSAVAKKCGIENISTPDFISSVYNTYSEAGSAVVQDILATIKSENGVTYFPRVIGDTMVIRSFGKSVIIPYFRQAGNLPVLPCMAEVTDPTVSRDSTKVRTKVQVYSKADNTARTLAEKEDADAIKRYGRRQGLVTYSEKDTATAQQKAATALESELLVLDEDYTLTAFGSDKVVAGCRLKVPIDGSVQEMWVLSVEHSYDAVHTMKLTLRRCEEGVKL